jgi:molybdopterin-containing oxidoreductase family iron-sulfur binding subunit
VGRRILLRRIGTVAASVALAGSRTVAGHATPTEGAPAPATPAAGRLRRWAMVIDLRKCDGCQSVAKPPQCTEACIVGHEVPRPMEWIQLYEANLAGGGSQFIPTPCQQCQNPPCTNVCPVAATFSTPEGPVLIDQERCIGCRICMEACPYDRRFFNWGNPPQPAEAQMAHYDPEHQLPAIKGTVMKCDFCMEMASAGRRPYCVQGCPNGAIYYGDLEEDLATNGSEVIQVSGYLSEHAGCRLKEELGTEPRVFYVPGHGELVGRDPHQTGRKPTEWPGPPKPGSAEWNRDDADGHW